MFGPADKRVLVLTNIKLPVEDRADPAGGEKSNYTEQLTWRDAATGKMLAESDFFEPLTINSLTPPGFGGRVYFPTADGQRLLHPAAHAGAGREQMNVRSENRRMRGPIHKTQTK